jgi:hypothetical protein
MSNFKLKPTHAPLQKCAAANFDNEGNVRRAFESLLEKCARAYEWLVLAEYPVPRSGRNPLKVDAAILDAFNLPRGYWQARDEKDSSPRRDEQEVRRGPSAHQHPLPKANPRHLPTTAGPSWKLGARSCRHAFPPTEYNNSCYAISQIGPQMHQFSTCLLVDFGAKRAVSC